MIGRKRMLGFAVALILGAAALAAPAARAWDGKARAADGAKVAHCGECGKGEKAEGESCGHKKGESCGDCAEKCEGKACADCPKCAEEGCADCKEKGCEGCGDKGESCGGKKAEPEKKS